MNFKNLFGATILFLLLGFGCSRQSKRETPTLFRTMPENLTGIDFNNTLIETEDFNIIEYLYFYNGGGVAIGDINNDGLPDIYFSSNQSSNKLFLNKGNFRFEDITNAAGVEAKGNWKTGVAMADINADGLLDIFSCGVGGYKKFDGRNQVFINHGNNKFVDDTKNLGLDFQGFSTHVAFLDFDLDGDVDIYLLNHSVHTVRSYGDVSAREQRDDRAGDKLYENQLVPSGKTYFKDVSSSAGIYSSQIAYGLGVAVADLNQDSWPDIYVSNDFHENDYLYLNNGNKTFRQVSEKSMAHNSRFSMGSDISDINNDALPDIVSLDMLSKDEAIRKASAGEDAYEIFKYKLKFGFHVQLARNALQIHRGIDSGGIPLFSDVAPLFGIEATDWSWAPLLADFDGDGFKDLFVANGIRRRPNDMDYISFISNDSVQRFSGYTEFLEHMPEGKVPDIFFKNREGISFEDVSLEWFSNTPDFSNGASYSDLDNDGDLDLVVNHINQNASVYQNTLNGQTNYLSVKLIGSSENRWAIGAKVWVYDSLRIQFREQYPSRGWQSSVEQVLHFGTGKSKYADSVIVQWPNGRYSIKRNVASGKVVFDVSNSVYKLIPNRDIPKPLFQSLDLIKFDHIEDDYSEFESERLVPYSLATQGPSISVGDLNHDGWDDLFVGGATNKANHIFVQNRKGEFIEKVYGELQADSSFEDTGSAILDVNGDGWNDIVVASGGNTRRADLRPRLYINNQKGSFIHSVEGIPKISIEASCVSPVDFDNDGDMDIFIGGRNVQGKYGHVPLSYLLINNGKGVFSESNNILPRAGLLGMVTDAVWMDINHDNFQDLIVSGDWMPISILVQHRNSLIDETKSFGLALTSGWWNCLELADIDNDGDKDILAGNLGLNSRLKATVAEPVMLYVSDIDQNGSVEQIMTYNNGGKSYPFISRDQLVRQVPSLKKKFLRFEDFKNVEISDIIPLSSSSLFIEKQATMFESCWLKNNGGSFEFQNLPKEVQYAPVFSIAARDFNGDGNIDFLFGGNLKAVQPELGQLDGGYGQAVLGNGKGGFKVQSIESGFFLNGEIRDIQFINVGKKACFVVGRNNGGMEIYSGF